MQLRAKVENRLRMAYYRARYPRVKFGRGVRANGSLIVRGPGRVIFGENVTIDGAGGVPNVIEVLSPEAVVTIGDGTYLNGVKIAGPDVVTIGARCILGTEALIFTSDFHGTTRETRNEPTTGPVTLGDDVWLASRAVVLCRSVLGDRSVVGLGAVVRGDTPADARVVSAKARIL